MVSEQNKKSAEAEKWCLVEKWRKMKCPVKHEQVHQPPLKAAAQCVWCVPILWAHYFGSCSKNALVACIYTYNNPFYCLCFYCLSLRLALFGHERINYTAQHSPLSNFSLHTQILEGLIRAVKWGIDRFRLYRFNYVVYLLNFSLSVVRSTHLVRDVKIGLGIANSHNNGKVSILASNV